VSNATAARFGQINQANAVDAVFLKTFGGEVLTAFEPNNVFLSRSFQKEGQGKSVQFPRFGTATAAYHTVGTELTGTAVDVAELIVTPDAPLVADYFLGEIDDLLTHYDARAPISNEMGIELATTLDEHILREGLLGSRITAVGTELPTGSSFNGSLTFNANEKLLKTAEVTSGSGNASSDAEKVQTWLSVLQSAAQRLDEVNAPKAGRFVAIRPQEYYPLVGAIPTGGMSLINNDINGQGSIANGAIARVMGFDIVMTNNLPKTDLSGETYHGVNAAKTVGLIGVNSSIAVANWKSVTTAVDWDPRRLGYLLTARYLKGIKYLRPECLIELKISTGTVI